MTMISYQNPRRAQLIAKVTIVVALGIIFSRPIYDITQLMRGKLKMCGSVYCVLMSFSLCCGLTGVTIWNIPVLTSPLAILRMRTKLKTFSCLELFLRLSYQKYSKSTFKCNKCACSVLVISWSFKCKTGKKSGLVKTYDQVILNSWQLIWESTNHLCLKAPYFYKYDEIALAGVGPLQ